MLKKLPLKRKSSIITTNKLITNFKTGINFPVFFLKKI